MLAAAVARNQRGVTPIVFSAALTKFVELHCPTLRPITAYEYERSLGFTRGMKLRREEWADLFEDEEHAGLLVPILALAHEHDPDPDMRPYKEPMDVERREELVVGIAACVPRIYRYFLSRRLMSSRAEREAGTHRRSGAKVGRNDPCPCGSGKRVAHFLVLAQHDRSLAPRRWRCVP
jgi:hypothetical protein